MSTTTITCPVCGAGYEKGEGQNLQKCNACGTQAAFAVYFASAEAFGIWQLEMQNRRESVNKQNLQQLRSRFHLVVGPESVALRDTQNDTMLLVNQYGKATTEKNVWQYSVSNLHQITLKSNGTIAASGDIGAQQGLLVGRKGIKAVLAAPRCTYLINNSGAVTCFGVCSFASAVSEWREIKAMACGKDHVVGLTEEGTVVLSSGRHSGAESQDVENWRNVKAIAAAFDYTLGLHENGTVSYAGPKEEMAMEVAAWRNIVAIAADNQYAVGLTEGGQVLIAGKANKLLDGGRSEARNWKDIICIGAGLGVIAGMTVCGELLLAGQFVYRDDVIAGFRDHNPMNQ